MNRRLRTAMRRILPQPLALAVRREVRVRTVANGRGYHEREIALRPRFVRRAHICWDVGASSGTYALAMARLSSHVYAFEPIPHSFETLERVMKLTGCPNATIRR